MIKNSDISSLPVDIEGDNTFLLKSANRLKTQGVRSTFLINVKYEVAVAGWIQ